LIKKLYKSSRGENFQQRRHDDLVEINIGQDVRVRQFSYTCRIVLFAVDKGGMAALIGKVIDGYNTLTYTWAGITAENSARRFSL
jgi:hypothetical protein